MRIRSNLPEESLYSEARRRGSRRRPAASWASGLASGSPMRRLMRLAVLLVLVLLLMREAADPQVYRNFFAALGAPLDPPPEVLASAPAPAPRLQRVADPAARGDVEAVEVRWSALVRRLDAEALEQLAGWLSQYRSARDADVTREPPRLPEQLEPNLASAAVSSGAVDPDRLLRLLRRPAEHAAALAALQTAVDRALLKSVSDATIWSAGDRLAFYRLLEAGQRGSFASFGDQFTRVGYTTLADQAPVYRGKPVWLEGAVARVELHEAVENPFGVERYYLVWLRPDDGSQRPVMAYATEVPGAVSQQRGVALVEGGPAVRSVGVFLRRHLYRSQRGSELAPVIVGRIELLEPTVANSPPPGEFDQPRLSLGWLIGLTAVVGICLTLLVTWYTSRAARWSRAMRQRGISPTFEPLTGGHLRGDNDARE